MLFSRRIAALSIAALVIVASRSAKADDGAQIAAAVQKAQSSATSFQMSLAGLSNVTSTMTVVLPDRVRSVMSFGPVTMETIVVGTASYSRVNGGAWLVSQIGNRENFAKQLMSSFANQSTSTVLPDEVDAGVTYGAFSTTMAAPLAMPGSGPTAATGAPLTVHCSYDKVTYLPHACKMEGSGAPFSFTMTYSAWNDPGNVVDVPADAPAPAASAAPAAN